MRKMSKEQIKINKELAKQREKHAAIRMSDREVNLAINGLGLSDKETESILDSHCDVPFEIIRKHKVNSTKKIKSKMTKKQIELIAAIAEKDAMEVEIERKKLELKRRMSKKQIDKVITELGAGSTATIPTFDSTYDHKREPYPDSEVVEKKGNQTEVINKILGSLGANFGNWSTIEKYNKLIHSKKIAFKDKLNTIAYLANVTKKTPLYLIPRKERQTEIRRIGLKKTGDISHPQLFLNSLARILPDDEFLKESSAVTGERTKFDYFDKLSKDKQITWARYAATVINIGDRGNNIYRDRDNLHLAPLAMKYACKMTGIPIFRGIFSGPFWIIYRTEKFFGLMTDAEYKVMSNLLFSYIGDKKKTIPIIESEEAINKLIPTLRNMKLLGRFKKILSDFKKLLKIKKVQISKLDLAKKLILGQEIEIK